jgi:acyl transferase domain-containing protein/acyl carrier protein
MSVERSQLSQAIAIIGVSGRFPNAEDVQAFWWNLEHGVESLVDFSDAEILASGVPAAFLQNPNFVKRGTPFDRADWFDAGYFGFNPREAETMDPQHRLFLECAVEALEDSGYGGEKRPDSVGVYAGTSGNSYLLSQVLANPQFVESVGPYQVMLGSDKDFLATRVSYKLDLKGPSMSVQTACSTSLVAVQMACQALLGEQCDLAMAGGVCLVFPQKTGYLFSEGMILSPDGHCRPFDAEGRGIRGGYGAGIVVLKRLEDAQRDRDAIRAVILGAAVNNDGADKMGYTTPSVEGQSTVISSALRMSGVDPASITFIEAHGTGTQVGDPIEIAGLERAFRAHTEKKQFCAIGAVKGNIGHLDIAAGVAGLIKAVLALQHKRIPPTINFRTANPAIDFANSPFYINDKSLEWESNGVPRRAGVSSFGIGGTNAHVVLEEAPLPKPSEVLWPAQLLVISARTSSALDAMTARMAQHLESNPSISLADVCYTAQVGRKRFPHRRAIVCSNREKAIDTLSKSSGRASGTIFEESIARPVIFMFSGQGSQHPGMAQGLYQTQPVFRQQMDFCNDFLSRELGCDLRTVLASQNGDSKVLNQTRIAQPALFAIEYSLARMWMSWGVLPDAMIGHSIGEYVAACLAGVFSLEDALRVVSARGRLMQQMPAGGMLAVSLPLAEACKFVDDRICLAAVNAPSFCTLSGASPDIATLQKRLESRGIDCRTLHTSHAFHSSMMDGALDPFFELLKTVKLSSPSFPFISNLTGTWMTPDQATDPSYWVDHLRRTVHFAEGINELATSPGRLFLEVGPGQTLSTFAKDCTRGIAGCEVLGSLPHPKDHQSDVSYLLNTVGKLWLAGVTINWEDFHKGEKLHRVPLPTYFFERKRYCVQPSTSSAVATPASSVPVTAPTGVGRREDLSDWFYAPSWQRSVSPTVEAAQDSYGPWLVFADQGALSDQVNEVLVARKETFITVRRGSAFDVRRDGDFAINPDRAEDYGRLLNEMQSRGLTPRSLLYLWGLPQESQVETRNGQAAFDSLLSLAKAFEDSRFRGPMDWVVVTSGLHAVSGKETIAPEQALLLGPTKVIPREYSNLTCRAVDIFPLPALGTNCGELVANLLMEPAMTRPWRPVAYRDGYRWEQTFERVRLPARQKSVIRERGVYLITGGMGGIGLTLATHFAEHGQARLALTGRSRLPERAEWQRWIDEHDEDNEVSRKILTVRNLELLGAEVLPLTADVSDRRAMAAAIDAIETSFGPINGVVHAAGIPGGGLVQLKTPVMAQRVLSPKVEGTLVLDSLLDMTKLDFFVLCSSIDAISPIAGAVDYSAANAFLDAYATAKRKKGHTLVSSINWDAWQDVGMAANAEVPRNMVERKRAFLESAIKPAEGIEAFRRVLASGMSQVAVITRDLPRLIIEVANSANPAEILAAPEKDLSRAPAEARHSRPDLASAFVPTETDTQKRLADIWIEVLGIGEIGIDDNFFEMGGHSLLATGILSRIRNSFGVSVPLRTIFETPTIRQLSSHLDTLLWIVSGKSAPTDETGEREEVEL